MSNILVGVTGGIACYKTAYLVREFVKSGHNVKVMMTKQAEKFVGYTISHHYWPKGKNRRVGDRLLQTGLSSFDGAWKTERFSLWQLFCSQLRRNTGACIGRRSKKRTPLFFGFSLFHSSPAYWGHRFLPHSYRRFPRKA